ncbi:MAG TPA: amidohydrolase family protein [Steroidobacteraceae bacterium]|jgi:imidazolonepropionase-like amidohydrolase|nr:amidohydrolase family protein [Steroidobacteraceae bacterium]
MALETCTRWIVPALVMVALSPTTAAHAAAPTTLRCGVLIDGRTAVPQRDVLITVADGRIVAVGPAATAGAAQIDRSADTCLPGLIDAHAHLLIATDDYQVDHVGRSSGFKALRGLHVAQALLRSGWTTLRVLGDADVHYAHLDVRSAIDDGLFVGPRITGAGHYLSITGGGGDLNFVAPEQHVVADGLVVDGADALRRAVRTEVRHGSDWIKVLASGAMMSSGNDPASAHYSPEELHAIVEEATRLGVPVAAHAHSAQGLRAAVLAGVRTIEHGTFVDDEGLRLMAERKVFFVPTLYVGDYYLEEQPHSDAQAKMNALTRRYRAQHVDAVRKALRAGVRIGVGTDYVGFPPTQGVRELKLLVEAGMTPMQAIQAATRVNAELLRWQDRIGTVEPGKLADIIAVRGDPLQDLAVLERVGFVMLGGEVVCPGNGCPTTETSR